MPNAIGNGVTLRGFFMEHAQLTFNLKSDIVAGDVGKAVAQDTTAANTVKLAGDGDVIVGRLETFENRVQEGILVGAVSLQFLNTLPVKSGLSGGDVIALGKFLVGAGAGEVKASATVPAGSEPIRVWELTSATLVTAQKL